MIAGAPFQIIQVGHEAQIALPKKQRGFAAGSRGARYRDNI